MKQKNFLMVFVFAMALATILIGAQSFQTFAGEKKPGGETMNSQRYTVGMELLDKIDGRGGQAVVDSLKDIAPDFGRMLIEFPFGDIYSRPALDLKSREIATVAALTAMGYALPQLAIHIEAALNVGCSRDEIVEAIMQMAVYAGFPAALNGLFTAKKVFAEHKQG